MKVDWIAEMQMSPPPETPLLVYCLEQHFQQSKILILLRWGVNCKSPSLSGTSELPGGFPFNWRIPTGDTVQLLCLF